MQYICHEAGISEATYYDWKAKYGGLQSSNMKKMKDLEDEIDVSNRCLPISVLSDRHSRTLSKKHYKTVIKRDLARYLVTQFALSIR